MKGIILAGGFGIRLMPLTKITNKHLLPIYNKFMIHYPLQTLIDAGIKEIMIVTGSEHTGDFLRLLGTGRDFNIKLSYEMQEGSGGIAEALGLAKDFIGSDNCVVILGDNIIEDNIKEEIDNFEKGAKIFLKQVPDPERFGVPELNGGEVVSIEEKPKNPKSSYAITGIYIYDNQVFDIIKTLKPSQRSELEITDVNNEYIKKKEMKVCFLKGYWTDAGTVESLHKAAVLVREKELKKQ